MNKEFILKESPLLKIILRENEFEIINTQYRKESGIFKYSKLYNIKFREESLDHYGSIIILVMSLFSPTASRGAKFKERIIMNYDGKQRKMILFEFDKVQVDKAITEIRKQMDPKYFTESSR